MPCSRVPVSLDSLRIQVLPSTICIASALTLSISDETQSLHAFALRPIVSLSTLRHGCYLPPRKTRYNALDEFYVGRTASFLVPASRLELSQRTRKAFITIRL